MFKKFKELLVVLEKTQLIYAKSSLFYIHFLHQNECNAKHFFPEGIIQKERALGSEVHTTFLL